MSNVLFRSFCCCPNAESRLYAATAHPSAHIYRLSSLVVATIFSNKLPTMGFPLRLSRLRKKMREKQFRNSDMNAHCVRIPIDVCAVVADKIASMSTGQ